MTSLLETIQFTQSDIDAFKSNFKWIGDFKRMCESHVVSMGVKNGLEKKILSRCKEDSSLNAASLEAPVIGFLETGEISVGKRKHCVQA